MNVSRRRSGSALQKQERTDTRPSDSGLSFSPNFSIVIGNHGICWQHLSEDEGAQLGFSLWDDAVRKPCVETPKMFKYLHS